MTQKRYGALKITEEAYAKRNKKMRSKHKSETGNTLGDRQTSGTGKRRISFACRFAGMKGSMKNAKGEPTPYAMALKKWGFGSREAAAKFCRANKAKKKSPMASNGANALAESKALLNYKKLDQIEKAEEARDNKIIEKNRRRGL